MVHRLWEILQNFKFYNRPNWDGRKLMIARLPLQYKYSVPVKFCLLFYLSASQDKLQRNRRNCLEDDFYRPLGYFRLCLPLAGQDSGERLIREILLFPLFWVGSIPFLPCLQFTIKVLRCRIYLRTRYIFNSSSWVYNVMAGEAERCNLHWLTALSGSGPDNEAQPLSAMKASWGQAREIMFCAINLFFKTF